MAITARFAADFSSFYAAVDKADAKLTDFTQGAGRVEKALNRMVDQFSGRRLIQEATLMEKAVAEIGGASKLTAGELERVSSRAAEAVEKLRAMGADVPAGLQKLAGAARDAGTSTGGWLDKLKSVNGLLGGLGIGLSVGAVVSFGKAILDDADALTKMADRTGISVTALQRLQVAGDDAGNSIEDMTGAINQLQNRLASGDKSAFGAITKLGLDLDQIKNLRPENQFIAISDALRQMTDPAQQVQVAMDLFGKQGANILPTLKRGFDDLRDSTVGMSEDTVKVLDDAGDALSRWWRTTKGITAEAAVELARFAKSGFNPSLVLSAGIQREAEQQSAALEKALASVTRPKSFANTVNVGIELSEGDLKAFDRDMDEARKRLDEQREAAKNAGIALADYRGYLRSVTETARPFGDIIAEIDGRVVEGVRYYASKGVAVEKLARMYELTAPQVDALNSQLKIEALVAQAASQQIGTLRESWTGLFEGLKLDVPEKRVVSFGKVASDVLSKHLPTATQVWAGRLGGLGDLFGSLQGKWSEFAGTVARGIEGVLNKLASGNVFGAVVAGVTAAVTAISRIWKKAEQEVNPVRQAFVDAAGGLGELNRRAHEAGMTLDRVLDAKNPEQYKLAIDELNAAFEFQDAAMRTLDEAVKRYGFSLEELGPALARQSLDKIAQGLFQDFKVLTGAGIDVDTVIGKMGASINQFVADALRTGTEIPAAMAPMLQRMVEMGMLTDATGAVITDLGASGVTFSETMTQGFAKVVDAVKRLTDAIARGLGLAIENIPDPQIEGRVSWKIDPIPSDGIDRTYQRDWEQQPIPMANGGDFMVKRPTLFLAGEAGPERATFTPIGKMSSEESQQDKMPTAIHVHIGDREIGTIAIEDIMRGGKNFGKFRALVRRVA